MRSVRAPVRAGSSADYGPGFRLTGRLAEDRDRYALSVIPIQVEPSCPTLPVTTARRCFSPRPTSPCAPGCPRRSPRSWRIGSGSTSMGACARPARDGHGLPIEWKIEEENYRAKGKQKPDLSDPAAMIAFRRECRAYAEHWLNVQRDEFKRLGVTGDWDHPYTTMDYAAEAQIARELMKFAANGTLYRGSKPVMWSVVEKTALAEAEVEYEDFTSDTVWVKFPVIKFNVPGSFILNMKSSVIGTPEGDSSLKAESERLLNESGL